MADERDDDERVHECLHCTLMEALGAWREDWPRYDSDGAKVLDGGHEADMIGAFLVDVFAYCGTEMTDEAYEKFVDNYTESLKAEMLSRRDEAMGRGSNALN